MLLALGFDSQFCILEALITGIVDNWPKYLRPRRLKFTAVMVVFMAALGVSMITQGGIYVFQVANWSQLVISGHTSCQLVNRFL